MLELKNISFEVSDEGQDKEIIRDISLSIPSGKLAVITGPNGGGKSTLARLIMGIEKPTSGAKEGEIGHGCDFSRACRWLKTGGSWDRAPRQAASSWHSSM